MDLDFEIVLEEPDLADWVHSGQRVTLSYSQINTEYVYCILSYCFGVTLRNLPMALQFPESILF